MSKPLKNYAFDFAASIESREEFDEIPLADKIAAMRKRLDDIENENNPEAFAEYDSYTIEPDEETTDLQIANGQ